MRPLRSSLAVALRGLVALGGTALLLGSGAAPAAGGPAPSAPPARLAPAAPDQTWLRGLLAVSAHSPERFAVGVVAEDGRAVEVYEGTRLLGRYENGRFGYGWLYALAASPASGDEFLAVYADTRTARLVRLLLGPQGLRAAESAPLELKLHAAADLRYELVSVHDLDVGRDGRVFLTGSFVELRQPPGQRGAVGTGRHPTLLVELALAPGPDGLRATVAGGGRCFTVIDPESRHWRVAADRATGHVYAAPLDGMGVLAFRPFPTGIGRVPHRSFQPVGGPLVDIAAGRGVVAVATRGAPGSIDLYDRARPVGRLAGSGAALALAFFAGVEPGSDCAGEGGVLLESANRQPALATAPGQVTRHRWCERLVGATAAAAPAGEGLR